MAEFAHVLEEEKDLQTRARHVVNPKAGGWLTRTGPLFSESLCGHVPGHTQRPGCHLLWDRLDEWRSQFLCDPGFPFRDAMTPAQGSDTVSAADPLVERAKTACVRETCRRQYEAS